MKKLSPKKAKSRIMKWFGCFLVCFQAHTIDEPPLRPKSGSTKKPRPSMEERHESATGKPYIASSPSQAGNASHFAESPLAKESSDAPVSRPVTVEDVSMRGVKASASSEAAEPLLSRSTGTNVAEVDSDAVCEACDGPEGSSSAKPPAPLKSSESPHPSTHSPLVQAHIYDLQPDISDPEAKLRADIDVPWEGPLLGNGTLSVEEIKRRIHIGMGGDGPQFDFLKFAETVTSIENEVQKQVERNCYEALRPDAPDLFAGMDLADWRALNECCPSRAAADTEPEDDMLPKHVGDVQVT